MMFLFASIPFFLPFYYVSQGTVVAVGVYTVVHDQVRTSPLTQLVDPPEHDLPKLTVGQRWPRSVAVE